MTTKPIIAIIGGGNMGSSIISGLLKNDYPPQNLWVAEQNLDRLAQLKQTFGIHTSQDNVQAIKKADVVVFAVKPQVMAEVIKPLAKTLEASKPLIISIAAGVKISSIQKWLSKTAAIVRAMPNTPALIGCGMTALFANSEVSAAKKLTAELILRALGQVTWLDNEALIDVATAVSGSGPAYYFLIMEAMEQAAITLGLDAERARLLTIQTAYGAAKLAMQDPTSLEVLRERVTSKGGTTEAAIEVMEQNNIREVFRKTLETAKIRAEELAEQMDK